MEPELSGGKRYRLGIDIGGTFTDFIAVDQANGSVATWKVLTTADDPSVGVTDGLKDLLAANEIDPAAVSAVIHATTLITNVIIERKGAKTGLITTKGFADLIEIGREVRYSLYDLFLKMPEPLVSAALRAEVEERIGAGGDVIRHLDESSLRLAIKQLAEQDIESVAVCFLHSYVNDAHEQHAAKLIGEEHPELSLSVSAEVAREIREYERLSTTVANAYVQPLAASYLKRMRAALKETGVSSPLRIMLSNGGIATAETAADLPVRMVESGPAAGALIAGHYGRLIGERHVLAFDMGGTTAKLCLVDNGEPMVNYSLEIARVHRFKRGSGLPIRTPSVELIEIGAGGGSIAHVDELGLLAVGPQSAGSEPGPACYGFGGCEPTVTDADLTLGYLDPDYFLGGEMALDPDASLQAIEEQFTAPLGMDAVSLAWGIHDLVNENMATAANVYIAERGRDPRDYTLIATGGAGPVHAASVARKIGLSRVVVPPAAGVASASGLLVAPLRMDFAHSYVARLDEIDWPHVNSIYDNLEVRGREDLRAGGVPDMAIQTVRSVDMRYVNQGHEVTVPIGPEPLTPESFAEIEHAFEAVYRELFGRTIPGVPLECVTWRLTVSGPVPDVFSGSNAPESPLHGEGEYEIRPYGTRPVYFPEAGGYVDSPVYRRERLPFGFRSSGPAVIQEAESTTVVGPIDRFAVDERGNIVIALGGAAPA